MNGLEFTKQLAAELGVRIQDLLVMARNNDPYSIGTPANMRDVEWFMDLWERFGFQDGVHLRRIHYQVMSPGDVRLPDGGFYQNVIPHWQKLSEAGKKARITGAVSPHKFTDRRNPEPIINWHPGYDTPYISMEDSTGWRINGLSQFALWVPQFKIPEPEVGGYSSFHTDQPYLLEVWVEKSTMNDILEPLCMDHGANLVTSIGFQSLTASVNLLKRATQAGKPARVLYISDFDPAGERMPIAVARQCQYQLEQCGFDVDLEIEHLFLTPEQVRNYRLPRVPIKEADRRRQGFEDRHGEGAVELDALEALHPGEFEKLVRASLSKYQDSNLREQFRQARQEAEHIVLTEWQELVEPFNGKLETTRETISGIFEKYREPLEEIASQLNAELAPHNKYLSELHSEFEQAVEAFDPELPDRPKGSPDGPMCSDPLFSSSRTHLEQLDAFKRHGAN